MTPERIFALMLTSLPQNPAPFLLCRETLRARGELCKGGELHLEMLVLSKSIFSHPEDSSLPKDILEGGDGGGE